MISILIKHGKTFENGLVPYIFFFYALVKSYIMLIGVCRGLIAKDNGLLTKEIH